MAIDELGFGLLAAIGRFIAWIFVDILMEILIKGLGYLLCKPFKTVDFDGITSFWVGLIGWLVIAAIGFAVWSSLSKQIGIDICLDSGGRYNYTTCSCEYKSSER